mgnify:CR=1 FL=1
MKQALLPNYYKKIGLGLFALSLIGFTLNLFYSDVISMDPQLLKWIFKDVLLIALLFIAFSREKEESEHLNTIRFEKLKDSVLVGGVFILLDSISELVFYDGNLDMSSGYKILIVMLLYYIITYNFKKGVISKS